MENMAHIKKDMLGLGPIILLRHLSISEFILKNLKACCSAGKVTCLYSAAIVSSNAPGLMFKYFSIIF